MVRALGALDWRSLAQSTDHGHGPIMSVEGGHYFLFRSRTNDRVRNNDLSPDIHWAFKKLGIHKRPIKHSISAKIGSNSEQYILCMTS